MKYIAVFLGLFLWLKVGVLAADTCAQILEEEATEDNSGKIASCQMFETSILINQMSDLLAEGLSQLLAAQGIDVLEGSGNIDKRKHEYLRFGKRKHEYLRFGKRKHEYLRFGKRKHEYLRFGKRSA